MHFLHQCVAWFSFYFSFIWVAVIMLFLGFELKAMHKPLLATETLILIAEPCRSIHRWDAAISMNKIRSILRVLGKVNISLNCSCGWNKFHRLRRWCDFQPIEADAFNENMITENARLLLCSVWTFIIKVAFRLGDPDRAGCEVILCQWLSVFFTLMH